MTPRTLAHQVRDTAARAAWPLLVLMLLAAPCLGAAPATASALSSPFPRLAIWWPDTHTRSVAELSRCDVLALQNNDSGLIPGLRAANPGITLLGTTSACELNYSLGGADDPVNVEIRNVSTDWMLTQAGSTLTSDVSTSATSIPVEDTSKFVVGEMVLVDHELMRIDAIGSSSLTVMVRGPVNPPGSHASGTRIASVVRHWPGTITMDLSTGCPVRDVGHGPETWAGWEARRSQSVLASADWDGLLLDALQSDPSWMVGHGDVRSIDPSRTNGLVTDGYAAFDAAWDTGAVAYGNALRAYAGDRILVGNGNLRNYDLNGNIFEEYPYTNLPLAAWKVVFVGPFGAPRASYPEWCAHAAAPGVTLIQVYGAANNYRLMRFGLCTALMNDGYFSYARSSAVHTGGSLDWFDEYDNAGAGRGYLGQPFGAAFRTGDAWRRDYAGGISLVNPTTKSVTVKLGGTFRKIKGRQDRKVNDGTAVTSVTIPSQDGIILLRIPTVSLRAPMATLAYGDQTTLTVTVAPAIAGTVRLERRAAGASIWKTSATMSLGGSGAVSVGRSPGSNTEYRAVSVGTGVVSRTVKISVRPRLSIHASTPAVAVGGRVVFSGAITHTGRVPLLVQRRAGTSWKTVRHVLTSANGHYRTTITFAKRGAFSYRVRADADARHLAAVSDAVSVLVR